MKGTAFRLAALLVLAMPASGPVRDVDAQTPPAKPAAPPIDENDLRDAVRRNELVSLNTIVDWIDRHYVGKIIEVELSEEKGRLDYEVDLLTPYGDLLEFDFDARSGKLLSVDGHNIERARRR